MSVATTVSKIDDETLKYAPQVLAQITTLEVSAADLPNQTKKQIALNAIIAGAHVGEGVPIPAVAGISELIDVFVSILKASGLFKSKPAKVVAVSILSPPGRDAGITVTR